MGSTGGSGLNDMSIVYAIEARDGSRGTLTDAFGVYSDPMISAFVHKVRGLKGDAVVWMPRP